jgi:Flp pilus assembly protein TadD
MTTLRKLGMGLCIAVAAAACSGCSTLPSIWPHQSRKSERDYAERKQHVVAAFERQRDQAQVQAAIDCWERGEVHKSIAMLEAIVQRNSRDVNARLRLAEIHASQLNVAEAIEQLTECLRHAPDHAEAHHQLGLILTEMSGQEEQARFHLQRACELDPDNPLYLTAAQEHAASP